MLQWNCRNMSNKLEYLDLRCPPFTTSHVLIIQESFLNSDKHALLSYRTFYRFNRLDRFGGGLLIAVHPSVASYPLNIYTFQQGSEIMGARIIF